MVAEAALQDFFLRFQQMRVFSNGKDHPRQIRKAAPVLWVILAIEMATLGKALAGVADPKAVSKVVKTNSL